MMRHNSYDASVNHTTIRPHLYVVLKLIPLSIESDYLIRPIQGGRTLSKSHILTY